MIRHRVSLCPEDLYVEQRSLSVRLICPKSCFAQIVASAKEDKLFRPLYRRAWSGPHKDFFRERKRGYHACDRKTLVLARLFPSDGVSDDPEACQNSRSNLRNSCPQWYLKNNLLDSLPLEQRYSEMAFVSR